MFRPAVTGPRLIWNQTSRWLPNRGWCNLTFTVSGRSDVVLDVQFYADGDGGQCVNTLPAGQYRSVFDGTPVTIGIDADGRSGGCQFLLRLRRV
ncbi:hypothetical protein [Streptomyces sp. NBC_00582]|uniref:hypothetical protein n=1 Tax=Streptomyces sp. NBC_00582 TaxID=2975783 RepID=UPI002E813AC8|nr:hypothetical protein [Streptomyces sp. NBC_00582]WUB59456.1 hypothetical protein OG852_03095 [Streptomyces sp. NBC_00582]